MAPGFSNFGRVVSSDDKANPRNAPQRLPAMSGVFGVIICYGWLVNLLPKTHSPPRNTTVKVRAFFNHWFPFPRDPITERQDEQGAYFITSEMQGI